MKDNYVHTLHYYHSYLTRAFADFPFPLHPFCGTHGLYWIPVLFPGDL